MQSIHNSFALFFGGKGVLEVYFLFRFVLFCFCFCFFMLGFKLEFIVIEAIVHLLSVLNKTL